MNLTAVSITDMVYCEGCGDTHAAVLGDTREDSRLSRGSDCNSVEPKRLDKLPIDWEARFEKVDCDGTTQFLCWPKNQPLLECHRSVFYLAD